MESLRAGLRRLREELRQAWARFRALTPRWQASLAGAATLFVLLVALAAVAVAVGGANDGDSAGAVRRSSPAATRPAKRTPSPTPRPSATPTPTPEPTPTPTAAPPSPPVAGGYGLVQVLPSVTFLRMVGFSMVPGSSDEAVIITQDGAIWRISLSESFPPQPFGDISALLVNANGYEEGLLGLAFSPNYGSDGFVYLYYTEGSPGPSVVARFQVVSGSLDVSSKQVVLAVLQPYPNHNGGQLSFGPDGRLYLGLGDGGGAGDPDGHGQNAADCLGSILRIDVSAGPNLSTDGQCAGKPGIEVYAYGLRNPWRFTWDRVTGEMWAGDVGQNKWEEVDRIAQGGNYGWNIMEGFECYNAASCDQSGLLLPRAAYGHGDGCSVTGGYVYRGAAMPELYGWYVYGDFCSGKIWALNTADGSDPVLLADTGSTIASFAELPDGELLALAFDPAVYRLVRNQ